MGVTEILCSFRLDLEGKTGKETADLSANNFALFCFYCHLDNDPKLTMEQPNSRSKKLMYISLIKNIQLRLIQLHSFQLLVLLSLLIEITSFVGASKNFLCLWLCSERPLITEKELLNSAKQWSQSLGQKKYPCFRKCGWRKKSSPEWLHFFNQFN